VVEILPAWEARRCFLGIKNRKPTPTARLEKGLSEEWHHAMGGPNRIDTTPRWKPEKTTSDTLKTIRKKATHTTDIGDMKHNYNFKEAADKRGARNDDNLRKELTYYL